MQQQLDRSQWEQHHQAIWGRHTWPTGTLISVSHQAGSPEKDARGPFRTAGFAPVDDPAAIWALIEPLAARGDSTWIGVGALSPELAAAPKGTRGKKADVLALPALFADLDIASAAHAASNLPTAAEAKAWIAQMPVDPTLVVFTGGGVHVWVALETPLDPHTLDGQELLGAWKAWWVARAAETGRDIDAGVLADAARVLRPAGTVNPNQGGKAVKIHQHRPEAVYGAAELTFAFPTIPAEPKRALQAASSGDAVRPARVIPATVADATKVGDRFALTVPASRVLIEVYGAVEAPGSGLILPRPDGTHAPDANARVYSDEPVERVTLFGERVRREWAEYGAEEPHSWSSWDLLARVGCDGDFKRAAKLAAQAEASGWDDLGALFTGGDPGQEHAAAGDISAIDLAVAGQDLDLPGAQGDTTVLDAFNGRTEGVRVELDEGLHVVIGGRRTGLYKWVKDAEGNSDEVPVTRWVAWKRASTEHLVIDPTGTALVAEEPTYTVEILTARGHRMSREGFDSAAANDARKVLDRLDVGAALPTSTVGTKQAGNMLRELGRFEGATTTREFHSLGWLHDGGRWVYLMPFGSVDAQGCTDGYAVEAPVGSQAGALQPALRLAGFDRVAADARRAAASIASFLAIAPTRRDITFTLLGAVFAGPLALSRRTAVILAGKPGAGKSQIASAAQAFTSAVGVDGRSFALTLARGTSKVAAEVTASYTRHTLAVFDDFRHTGAARSDEAATEALTALVQASYGGDSAGKGTQTGGLRAARTAETLAVVTAEMLPAGEAIVSRSIPLELKLGEVRMSPRGAAPLDYFAKAFGETGEARALFASYVQWLAGCIEAAGSLTAFTREMDALKATWMSTSPGRAPETVATVATGWAMLRQFATEAGFADFLPAAAEIDEVLSKLVSGAEKAAEEATPARRIVEKARDLLHSGTGYLEGCDRDAVRGFERTTGWELTGGGDFERWTHGSRMLVGIASSDRAYVAIPADAVDRIKTTIGLGGMGADQVRRSFEELVAAGTTPGGQAPTRFGIAGRPRSYIVPAALFEVQLTPTLPFDAEDLAAEGGVR